MVDYNTTYMLSAQTIANQTDESVIDVYVRLEKIMLEIETAFAHFSPLFDSVTDEMLRRNLIEKRPPITGGQSTQVRKP
jgi:hypothetical protein